MAPLVLASPVADLCTNPHFGAAFLEAVPISFVSQK